MWFLKTVLGWLSGDVVGKLTDAYTKAKDTEAEIIKKRLDGAIETQKLAQQVRLATAGFIEMRVLSFFVAFPFVLHVNLVGLDTNFKLGMGIPAFPDPFDAWEGTILLSFFGFYAASKGVTSISALLAARR